MNAIDRPTVRLILLIVAQSFVSTILPASWRRGIELLTHGATAPPTWTYSLIFPIGLVLLGLLFIVRIPASWGLAAAVIGAGAARIWLAHASSFLSFALANQAGQLARMLFLACAIGLTVAHVPRRWALAVPLAFVVSPALGSLIRWWGGLSRLSATAQLWCAVILSLGIAMAILVRPWPQEESSLIRRALLAPGLIARLHGLIALTALGMVLVTLLADPRVFTEGYRPQSEWGKFLLTQTFNLILPSLVLGTLLRIDAGIGLGIRVVAGLALFTIVIGALFPTILVYTTILQEHLAYALVLFVALRLAIGASPTARLALALSAPLTLIAATMTVNLFIPSLFGIGASLKIVGLIAVGAALLALLVLPAGARRVTPDPAPPSPA